MKNWDVWAVHLLTASGAALALGAALAAAHDQWPIAFFWLGIALIVDGIDGPLARRSDVIGRVPWFDGAMLDFVVDYATYVLVPAIILVRSDIVSPPYALIAGIVVVVVGALYFADTRMKTPHAAFRGRPHLYRRRVCPPDPGGAAQAVDADDGGAVGSAGTCRPRRQPQPEPAGRGGICYRQCLFRGNRRLSPVHAPGSLTESAMSIIAWITDPSILASLVTLTVLEIVLGIDNIVFISVIIGKLPEEQANRARQIGLALALVFRIALLSVLFALIGLTAPLFSVFDHGVSLRDLVLLGGGLFLLIKATQEIHKDVEAAGEDEATLGKVAGAAFSAIIAQIVVIDVIFSIDSIVTAIGIAEQVSVMIIAVILAVAVMYAASGTIAGFIHRHPTARMLALAFLLMIGFALVADGAGFHIPRGYLYAAMAFSSGVEALNVIARRNRQKRAT